MLNACWMHALHMWTRLISALMFISVPLFASQNNQKHTDQCVSNGVWHGQVSQKTQGGQHMKTYALAPLRSCHTLLSHKCGWAFGSSVHVDWQVQRSIKFCTTSCITRPIQKDANTIPLDPQFNLIEGNARINGHYSWQTEQPHRVRLHTRATVAAFWGRTVDG